MPVAALRIQIRSCEHETGQPEKIPPRPGLIIVSADGRIFGTTGQGGTDNNGTLFVIETNGTRRILYDFGQSSNDFKPTGPLVLASDGRLYGTTPLSRRNECRWLHVQAETHWALRIQNP